MAQGFVYILINPAIPGYIKVGKTTKTPEERAKEISAATGVPTPFIVAYDASFVDCNQAETYIHTLLETRGISRTPDREFFATTLREAIAVVMEAERNLRRDPNLRGSDTPSPIGGGVAAAPPSASPKRALYKESWTPPVWLGVLEQAKAHRYGLGDTLENKDRAIALYEQAVRLVARAPDAYVDLSELYAWRGDADEGLRLLTRGAEGGVVECWDALAAVYMGENASFGTQRHLDNARKSFRQFFRCVKPMQSDPGASHLCDRLRRYIALCGGHADAADTAVIRAFGNDFAQALNRLPEAERRTKLGELRDLTPQFHDVVDAILAAPAPIEVALGELRDLMASLPNAPALGVAPGAYVSESGPPCEALITQAARHRTGEGGYTEDPEEALQLYQQAATLGCGMAYRLIGQMYEGNAGGVGGFEEDEAKALSAYAEGIRKAAYQCYPALAKHFGRHGDQESASKCWQAYSRHLAAYLASEPPRPEDVDDIYKYLFWKALGGGAILIDGATISAFRDLLTACPEVIGHPNKSLLELLESLKGTKTRENAAFNDTLRTKQKTEVQAFLQWLQRTCSPYPRPASGA